ncbi:MAG: phage tail protein [Balneolaceae bacterium]
MAEYYPPAGFHFRVNVEGLDSDSKDIGFQEVSGIDATVGETTYEEGGENRFVHRLPERVTYEKLVLKRGVLQGSELIGWFKKAVESFQFEPKGVLVTLLNEEHEPLESWSFINAYPVKWSVDSFNSTKNEVAVETIELAFQYFRRMEVDQKKK